MKREHYNKTNEQIVATDAMIVTTIIISFQCFKVSCYLRYFSLLPFSILVYYLTKTLQR